MPDDNTTRDMDPPENLGQVRKLVAGISDSTLFPVMEYNSICWARQTAFIV